MMMKRILSVLLTMMSAIILSTSCQNSSPVDPQIPEDQQDFILEVTDVTPTSCHFSVTPADNEMTYVVMLVPKADFDEFENDYKYQDNDLEWFERKALEEDVPLDEWMESFLKKGHFEGDEQGLMPNEYYYLYAYGMTKEGYFTTGVTKFEFRTADIPMTELVLDVQVSEIGLSSAKVSVKPDDPKARYFVNVFTVGQYEEWGGNEDAFANQADALVDYYVTMGATLKEIVANLTSVGPSEIVFEDLVSDTEYIAYAIGVDDNFFVNSAAEVVRFTTLAAKESSNTFTVNITGTTYCSVSGTVTPSNDDPFICTIQPKAQVELYEDDVELMYEVVATYDKWDALESVLYAGDTVNLEEVASLDPSTEYVVLCFGWDGAPTTALSKTEFVTEAAGGRPANQELDIQIIDVQHNKLTVKITPKLGLHYFYDCISLNQLNVYIAEEGSEDDAICRFLNERIDYGAEYFGITRAEYLAEIGAALGKDSWTFAGLEEDTEYLVVAASVNVSTGMISYQKGFRSETVRTTILIESDAEIAFVIDKYYDGSELAALDPAQFGKCDGRVMVPYTIVPNGSAAHWRTTFTYGEFSSWAERDDILFELDYSCDEDKTQGYAVVHYDQIVAFLGIAVNDEGYTGPYTIYEFKAERGGTSPAQEFIDSLTRSSDMSLTFPSPKKADK